MNTSCGCIYVGEGDDEYEYGWEDRDVVAEQPFECCECHQIIPMGTPYWCVSIDVHEWSDDPDTQEEKLKPLRTEVYQVCPDCRSVISELFCESIPFGDVWRAVERHVEDLKGEISADCLLQLTPLARDRALDFIDRAWEALAVAGNDDA